ncbi:MAG TPA: methyltransferase, partial [Thermoanaerobaculia bacterium]
DLREFFDPSAESALRQLIGGAIRTQAIYVAAKLGIADHLALGPRHAGDLAQRANVHAPTLLRVLRYLVSIGVFVQLDDQRFALNRPAEHLQTAHPRSLRPSALRAGEGLWDIASRLLPAVETGSTPYADVHSQTYFERMNARGNDAEFGARMSSSVAGLGDALARLDCIRDAKTIVDVGGGNGAILIAILRALPHLHGVLFERPAMLEVAREVVRAAGMESRCDLIAGDFFERVPPGDVHLLSWILHDWDDERATQILRACRDGERSSVVIVEVPLPERAETRASESAALTDPYSLDLQMLLLTGGRERTETEYRHLFESAGYEWGGTAALNSFRGASAMYAASKK